MDPRPRPPAIIVVLAWLFGIGAGITLLATPALMATGWAMRSLLQRLTSEGLVLPSWYPPLIGWLFVALIVLNGAVGVVSLLAARAFVQLRRWAWRWFDGLLVTSLIGLVGLMVFAGVIGALVLSRLPAASGGRVPPLSPLALGGGAGVCLGLGVVNAAPPAVMLWLLRSRYVRPRFDSEGERGTSRPVSAGS